MSAIPGGSAVARAHICVAFRVCYAFPHAEAPWGCPALTDRAGGLVRLPAG
jgi:hypothetical protein